MFVSEQLFLVNTVTPLPIFENSTGDVVEVANFNCFIYPLTLTARGSTFVVRI